jgi:hypothetical protein
MTRRTIGGERPAPDTAGLSAPAAADTTTLDYTVSQLSLADLHAGWADLFGRPPPKGTSRRLLQYAAAYTIQAKIHGGLKPAVRRKLLAFSASTGRDGSGARKPRSTLSLGSRLVREWQGRTHTVEVVEGGFLYAGQRYRSLSEVARAITGARWSGPRFFGFVRRQDL